ncbi:hypothetical protein JCM5353_006824 [Sporobolomyces roseus]
MSSSSPPTQIPSSSHSRPRYLEFLPTELLQDIIEHLVPTEYNVGQWLEHRKILRPLCLTSKRLSQITQPVLARMLWLQNEYDWREDESKDGFCCGCKRKEYWKNCRWLRLVVCELTPKVEAALQQLAAVASKLDDVAFGGTIFTLDRFMHHSESHYLSSTYAFRD